MRSVSRRSFPRPTNDTADLVDTALRELANRCGLDPDDPITLIGLFCGSTPTHRSPGYAANHPHRVKWGHLPP